MKKPPTALGMWSSRNFASLNTYKSRIIDPSRYENEQFVLYSVPAYPAGEPEVLDSAQIGSTKQIVRANDVLVCKINPRINRVWTVADHGQFRVIASSEWIVFRVAGGDPRFFAHYFRSDQFRELICDGVTGVGGSLTRAQPVRVAQFAVPVAPENEQKRIADKLDSLLAKVDACREHLDRVPQILKRFRQSVLAAAVSGQLTVEGRRGRGLP